MKVLVLGASGMVAQETIKALSDSGFKLKLFSRNIQAENYPTHEVLNGDVLKIDDLVPAIEGCDMIHVTVGRTDEALAMHKITEAAKDKSVKCISYVSGATVTKGNSWFPMIKGKYDAEAILKGSGIPYLIFRPTWFMESLGMMIQNGKATIIGKQPEKLHWIAASDFGKQLSKAYKAENVRNKELYCYGPEQLTINEALHQYVKARHPEIKKVSNAPFWLIKAIAFLTNNKELKEIISFFQYFEKTGETGSSDEAENLIGRPKTTLSNWLN